MISVERILAQIGTASFFIKLLGTKQFYKKDTVESWKKLLKNFVTLQKRKLSHA
jgi:hypothetical protein